jgi:hypothetical protein
VQDAHFATLRFSPLRPCRRAEESRTAISLPVLVDNAARKPAPFAPENAARIRASAPAAPEAASYQFQRYFLSGILRNRYPRLRTESRGDCHWPMLENLSTMEIE